MDSGLFLFFGLWNLVIGISLFPGNPQGFPDHPPEPLKNPTISLQTLAPVGEEILVFDVWCFAFLASWLRLRWQP